jgi:hypothetical protein
VDTLLLLSYVVVSGSLQIYHELEIKQYKLITEETFLKRKFDI